MQKGFQTYRLNRELNHLIDETIGNKIMSDFIRWLLEWEGSQLHLSRVPSLYDIRFKLEDLMDDRYED